MWFLINHLFATYLNIFITYIRNFSKSIYFIVIIVLVKSFIFTLCHFLFHPSKHGILWKFCEENDNDFVAEVMATTIYPYSVMNCEVFETKNRLPNCCLHLIIIFWHLSSVPIKSLEHPVNEAQLIFINHFLFECFSKYPIYRNP